MDWGKVKGRVRWGWRDSTNCKALVWQHLWPHGIVNIVSGEKIGFCFMDSKKMWDLIDEWL